MRFTYESGEETRTLDLEKRGDHYHATIEGVGYDVRVIRAEEGEFAFLIGSTPHSVVEASDGSRRWIATGGERFVLSERSASARGSGRERGGQGAGGESDIVAPMPGQVRAVQAEQGAQVEKGETLLLLEAMKMEIRIGAPRAGRVARLLVGPGQMVERDQLLVELE